MQTRDFGRLGTISALTLGGGGIGGVWGETDRAEAVATVRAAVDAGITMIDVAPGYGEGQESERVVGEAGLADDVLVTSKVPLADDEERDFAGRIRRGLHGSLERLGRGHLDLFLLHTQLRPRDPAVTGVPHTLGWENYLEVAAEFERLRDEGLIRAWGISAVGYPATVLDALRTAPRPDVAQVVVNPLDLSGDMWMFGAGETPANDAILAAANENGVAVSAIRAVAAGSLTTQLDRALPADHPAVLDFARAEPYRELAAELGETPADLAHRYALTVPGVGSVILGVKNRAELAECLAAEERGALTEEEMRAITALR